MYNVMARSIVIVSSGKIIGCIDACMIIEIAINSKKVKNITCVHILCIIVFVLYVYIIKSY